MNVAVALVLFLLTSTSSWARDLSKEECLQMATKSLGDLKTGTLFVLRTEQVSRRGSKLVGQEWREKGTRLTFNLGVK